MGSSFALLGTYVPKSATELFGSVALVLHLLAYAIYAKQVFASKIRPNVITWLMWLFGGVVEFLTYNAIDGSHWSTSALPMACVIGIGSICFAILIAQIQSTLKKSGIVFHKPERSDYFFVCFDVAAGGIWLLGGGASFANIIAVSTSIVTFIPIWRTTSRNPGSEQAGPWILWTTAYLFMLFAVMSGNGSKELVLYFFPVYYLLLHAVMAVLCLKK